MRACSPRLRSWWRYPTKYSEKISYDSQGSLMQIGACQCWREREFPEELLWAGKKTLAVEKQEYKRDFATKFAKTQRNRIFCNRQRASGKQVIWRKLTILWQAFGWKNLGVAKKRICAHICEKGCKSWLLKEFFHRQGFFRCPFCEKNQDPCEVRKQESWQFPGCSKRQPVYFSISPNSPSF